MNALILQCVRASLFVCVSFLTVAITQVNASTTGHSIADVYETVNTYLSINTQPPQRGHILDQTDISWARVRTNNSHTVYFTSPNQIIGKVLVRSIKTGNILAAHLLQAPRLIHRGQQVTLLVDMSGLQVRMKGHALSDVGAGDLVRVRNAKTKRVVEGTVKKAGIVQVAM